MMRRWLLCIFLVNSLAVCHGEDEAAFVLKSLRNERSRLVSGRCDYQGRRAKIHQAVERGFDTTVSGTVVFDGNRYRVDAVEPDWIVDPISFTPNPHEIGLSTSVDGSGKFIRGVCRKSFTTSGAESAFWLSFQPAAEISTSQDAFVPDSIRSVCLDPRCPTIFSVSNWNSGTIWSDAFSHLEDQEGADPMPWKVEKSADIWTLRVTSNKDEFDSVTEWSLVIDVNHGFVPIKYQAMTTPAKERGTPFPEFEINTDWQEMNGVMVPIRLSRKGFQTPALTQSDEFVVDFQWTDVNQSIPESAFSYETFPMDSGTGVQNVATKEWLKAIPVIPVVYPRQVQESRGLGFVGVNAIVLLSLLGLWLLNRYGKILLARWRYLLGFLAVAGTALGITIALRPQTLPRSRGVVLHSWSPVNPPAVPGTNIDLGTVPIGGHVHRAVLITNEQAIPLTLKECTSDCSGVRLVLPSMTVEPGERVGAFLDCNFDSTLPPGDRVITVRAVTEDASDAFTLTATVKLLAH